MTVDADLLKLMKRLKLGPLAPTLPERLALARAQQLDYAAFLTLLLSDEVQRRDQMAVERRVLQAGFEDYVTLEEFDWSAPIQVDRRQLNTVFSLRFLDRHEHVLFVGPVGVGPYCSLDSSLLNQSKSGAIYPNAQASALAIGDINGLQSSRLDPMENGLAGDLQGCCRLI